MTVRMLHISDLHLDCGFKTKEPRIAKLLREAQHSALLEMTRQAINLKCHIVALTGDVFSEANMSFKTEDVLNNCLTRLLDAGIHVVYLTGNHDYVGLQRSLKKRAEHRLFTLFSTPEPRSVLIEIEGQILRLVGSGHHTIGIQKNWAKEFPVAQKGELTLGFYHGMVYGSVFEQGVEEPYMACAIGDLKDKGYHYWALGHIHKRQMLDDKIAYAGSFQAVRSSENEKKGGWILDVTLSETKLNFLPLSTLEFREVRLELGMQTAENSLYSQLKETLEKCLQKEEGYLIVNVLLLGLTSEYAKISHEDFITEFLEGFQNERLVDLTLDLRGLAPLDSVALSESHYLKIAMKALENPQEAGDFYRRLQKIEEQGFMAFDFVNDEKKSLKNQLMYLFKED